MVTQRDNRGKVLQNCCKLQHTTNGQNARMAGIKANACGNCGNCDALKKSLRQPVSAFRHYAAPAASSTLGTWLSACTSPMGTTAQKAASTCERIREETDEARQKELKKSLPGFTPGCLIHDGGSRNEDEITQASPFVQVDIDPDHNPGIPMGEELKEALFQLPFIVFAGLSTRGTGVWALVEIENPAYRERHFHQLVQDIEKTGITVDASKGKHPHDFRFYSYDAHALWRQHWQVYSRMQPVSTIHQHRQPIRVQRRTTHGTAPAWDKTDITERYKFEGTPLEGGGKVTANGNTKRLKHECPGCGRDSYVRVVDTETGEYMPMEFGVCDHKNTCGYMQPVKVEHHRNHIAEEASQ